MPLYPSFEEFEELARDATLVPVYRELLFDTDTAVLAAQFNRDHKLATADAVIYATARRCGARLLTCDAHFAGLPDVTLYRKQGTWPFMALSPRSETA